MNIAEIDKNFAESCSLEGLKTYEIEQPPFRLFGLCREAGERDYKRLPHAVVEEIGNAGYSSLYKNTSGIRLRFKTDSQRIALTCKLPGFTRHDNMPRTASGCFDLYADGHYCKVFRPGTDESGTYSSEHEFEDRKMRDILINFPLYNAVNEVYISLEEDAKILACDDYKQQKPTVYYGSSITQGGCASHPGNCYCAMISQWMDADYVNLGFSGSARGELAMADYIGSLDMHAFVYDYDYNAPTAEHLQNTHEPFFKRFRQHQPNTPVIMVSRANEIGTEETRQRRDIIRTTYEKAIAAGDKNVYFIDGSEIYKEVGLDYCTVDCVHPNDLGFLYMAKSIGAVLEHL